MNKKPDLEDLQHPNQKRCLDCRVYKPLDDFNKRSQNKDGREGRCRDCSKKNRKKWIEANWDKVTAQHHQWYVKNKDKQSDRAKVLYQEQKEERNKQTRTYRLQYDYGITEEDYKELLRKQEGKCAICGATKANNFRDNLYVDHCHSTGIVRGLLCTRCNSCLGLFQDDVSILEAAIRYLNKERVA